MDIQSIIESLIAEALCDFQPPVQEVQFPGILTTDTGLIIGDAVFTPIKTVATIVGDNSQYYFKKGLGGVNTLCTTVACSASDITATVTRGEQSIVVTGAFVGPRPNSGPKGHGR